MHTVRFLFGTLVAVLAVATAAAAPSPAVADSSWPAAHSDPASNVTDTSATLNGRVDTNGRPTSYRFVYQTGLRVAVTPTQTMRANQAAPSRRR